jgi:predicted NAD/FAD-binding protein
MLEFPAETFLRFYANHGMMGWTGAPRWRTIVGGSRVYVDALLARHRLKVHTRTPVQRLERGAGGVTVHTAAGGARRFDRVVVATHTDQALALLDTPSPAERRVLGGLSYQVNDVWLHTDDTFLPAPRARASWNYQTDDCRAPEPLLMATYWMNSLQGLPGPTHYLVTLNPTRPIAASRVLGRYAYAHPQYDFAALRAQAAVPSIQGERGVYFAGAWQGFGFHEDGLRAGQEAAAALERDAASARAAA